MKLRPENLQETMTMLRIHCNRHSQIDIHEETGISRSCLHNIKTFKTRIVRLDTFVKLCYYFNIEVNTNILYEAVQSQQEATHTDRHVSIHP